MEELHKIIIEQLLEIRKIKEELKEEKQSSMFWYKKYKCIEDYGPTLKTE